jgi:ABC-type long-subunit fatty acid transport system fused permease/ATPase subunit
MNDYELKWNEMICWICLPALTVQILVHVVYHSKMSRRWITNMEKYCLKWNEFEANIRESSRNLREEQRFFDVTLATDVGQQIQDHKMILSAGSHFISDKFMKNIYIFEGNKQC